MGVIISAYCSEPREFSNSENAAMDGMDISISHGNWKEHLSELFLADEGDDDLPIDKVERSVNEFIEYYAGRIGLSDYLQWHLNLAQRLKDLIGIGRQHNCDLIGFAG